MKDLIVRLTLTVPDDMPATKALELLNGILNSGQAEATESAEDEDIDNPDAELASEMQIGEPDLATLYQ